MNNTQKPWIAIFGANSDMAVSTARMYASKGYNIYLLSRSLDSCQRTKNDLEIRYQIAAEAIYFDARKFSSHGEIYEQLPIKPIGVILAFGIMLPQLAAQSDINSAITMAEINYLGCITLLEKVAQDMESRKEGFIVGISSVAGERGRMSNYIYGSTKGALSIYLEGLRHRLAKSGVHVLTVKPGFVATKMTMGLDLPPLLTASPELVARKIYQATERKKDVIYVKGIWQLIMFIIKSIPNVIFHKTKM